ncbi:MAG: universal stress protein, partial [Gemmataceae bacterium]
LEPTLEMAKVCGANLLLYRVVQPVLRPSYIPEGSTLVSLTHSVLEQINQLQQQKQSEAQAYLNQVAEELRKRGFSVQTCVGVDEEPSVGILLESQAKHVDLIAMETHARRGVSRLLRGSVADKIVRGGTIPVFMHHPVPSNG